MKSKRLLKHTITDLKPLFIILCLVILGTMTWKVPPSNTLIIAVFIMVVTSLVYLLSTIFKNLKISIILSTFTLISLSMWYAIGFDLINTILLLCFIIALSQLIPPKKES